MRSCRLNTESSRGRELRARECVDTRQARLADMRIRMRNTIQTETDDERQARLADKSIHMRERLQEETDEERHARLAYKRIRNLERRQPVQCELNSRARSTLASFHANLVSCTFQEWQTCNESFLKLNPNLSLLHCTCNYDKKQSKLYSHENNMDPGVVPPELMSLTQVEEMLISPVMPMMSVYRLPHRQFGYNGHVINLPQNVSSFVSKLPRLPSDLHILLVRRNGDNSSHKDFKVCRATVMHALQWLKGHNEYFANIDHSHLAELSHDGDIILLATISLNEPNCSESGSNVDTDPYFQVYLFQ